MQQNYDGGGINKKNFNNNLVRKGGYAFFYSAFPGLGQFAEPNNLKQYRVKLFAKIRPHHAQA